MTWDLSKEAIKTVIPSDMKLVTYHKDEIIKSIDLGNVSLPLNCLSIR